MLFYQINAAALPQPVSTRENKTRRDHYRPRGGAFQEVTALGGPCIRVRAPLGRLENWMRCRPRRRFRMIFTAVWLI